MIWPVPETERKRKTIARRDRRSTEAARHARCSMQCLCRQSPARISGSPAISIKEDFLTSDGTLSLGLRRLGRVDDLNFQCIARRVSVQGRPAARCESDDHAPVVRHLRGANSGNGFLPTVVCRLQDSGLIARPRRV